VAVGVSVEDAVGVAVSVGIGDIVAVAVTDGVTVTIRGVRMTTGWGVGLGAQQARLPEMMASSRSVAIACEPLVRFPVLESCVT